MSPAPGPLLTSAAVFRLGFGTGSDTAIDTGARDSGVPVLAGNSREHMYRFARPAGRHGAFALQQEDNHRLGWARVPVHGDIEAATRRVYAQLFAATRGFHLDRIWNYVPAINQRGAEGLENYQAFSRGRSLAFEAELGPDFPRRLPAASAVGCGDDHLGVVFVASATPPLHHENPVQVPAYEYPVAYGPRSPSFARATIVPADHGGRDVFISGTAAIRGHATVAPGNTTAQLACTLENLRAISRVCELGDDLARGRAIARHAKVYLRHATDYEAVAAALSRDLLAPDDHVSYLHAAICRAELNVEIEVSVFGARS